MSLRSVFQHGDASADPFRLSFQPERVDRAASFRSVTAKAPPCAVSFVPK